MDIGKYVGLFLLKNEYCYLPGFGSLQIIKRTATFNKETLKSETPGYEVVFIKGTGALDDTFANFIANNERISIAHASNHIKDYCAYIKQEFIEGREIAIPGIGKFISKIGGEDIYFETDADLRIQGKQIPYFKISSEVEQKKKEETISNIIEKTTFKEPKSDEEIIIKPAQVNWGKLAFISAIVLVILGVVAFVLFNMNSSTPDKSEVKEEIIVPPPVEETNPINETNATDSSTLNNTTSEQTQVNNNLSEVKIIVNSYAAMDKAESRKNRLVSYGYSNVSTIEKGQDSLKYHVIITIDNSSNNDVSRIVDSVKKLLNPNGNVRLL
jgi:nucleoid DNA-binding protein